MTATLRIVAEGLRFPEGPIAMPDGSVVVVEIARGAVTRIVPDGRLTTLATPGGGPNGAAIGPDGKCYVCNNGGFSWATDPGGGLTSTGRAPDYAGGRIERIDLDTGKVERLYDRSDSGPLHGPNDIVFDRTGGFWFTDLGGLGERTMDRGGIYYARADGSSIREAVFPMMTPNGIGLSPDETKLYVAETLPSRVWAFDLAAPGQIAAKPWPAPYGGTLLHGSGRYRLFDSMAVDSAGNVCVASLGEGGLSVVSPAGDLLDFIDTGERTTTNICFGGPDLRTAYVTYSRSGRLAAMAWPRPGLRLNFPTN